MQTVRMVNSMERGRPFHSQSAFIDSSVSAPDSFQRVCGKIVQRLSDLSQGDLYTINALSNIAKRTIAEEHCYLGTEEVVAKVRAGLEKRGIVLYAAGRGGGMEKVTSDGDGDSDPTQPTLARPGTEEKILMLEARYAAGVSLWNENDCRHGLTEAQELAERNAQRLAAEKNPDGFEDECTFNTGELWHRRR